MADQLTDIMCDALDLGKQAVDFYEQKMMSCSDSIGKDVFEKVRQDKIQQVNQLQEIYDGLQSGQEFATVCTLGPESAEDVKKVFRQFAEKHKGESCPASEAEAAQEGVDLESKMVAFYEDGKKKVSDPKAVEFMQRLIKELRGHHMMLTDLQYYYDDPEGWFMKEEKSGLDGA